MQQSRYVSSMTELAIVDRMPSSLPSPGQLSSASSFSKQPTAKPPTSSIRPTIILATVTSRLAHRTVVSCFCYYYFPSSFDVNQSIGYTSAFPMHGTVIDITNYIVRRRIFQPFWVLRCFEILIDFVLDGYFLCQLSAAYGNATSVSGQKLTHMIDAIGAIGAFHISNGQVEWSALESKL